MARGESGDQENVLWTDQKSRENDIVNTCTHLEHITYLEAASNAPKKSKIVRIINLK